jgi:hypothetical protein
MANYIIIGGDGREYGPVSGEDLRKWISEERLNAQSLAKAESDAEFRPLSAFPEFAVAFGVRPPDAISPPPLAPAGNGGRDAALLRVKSPAVGLKVTAILNLILGLWSLVDKIFYRPNLQQFNSEMQQLNNPQMQEFMQKLVNIADGPFGMVNVLFELAMSVLILIGAGRMQSLRSYEFAFTAAILAMIPCLTPCCILGLPFGIWALVALNKPEVKSHFS